MRCTRIAMGRDRHGGLTLAALFLALMVLTLLAFACEEEAEVLPTASPASDVAERIGSPEASDIPEATASPSSASEEEARDILERAQERMSALITYHASLNMRRQTGSGDLETSIEMDVEQPDRAYAVVTSADVADFEMMFEGLKAYVRLPGKEWQTDEGTSGPTLQDFEQFAQLNVFRLADDIDMLPDAEVDGVPVRHLRGTISVDEYGAAATDLLSASGLDEELAGSVEWGAMLVDLYVSPDDFHVRRATVQTTMTVEGSELRMDADGVASAFNEPVDIPKIE